MDRQSLLSRLFRACFSNSLVLIGLHIIDGQFALIPDV